ncbi:MAG: hypothetical protein ABSG32_05730 [Terriglobia bacterium]
MELIAGWRFQHFVEKNGAVRHGQFLTLQTVENLNLVVPGQADLDDSLHKMVAIVCHPRCHPAVGFADHAIRG